MIRRRVRIADGFPSCIQIASRRGRVSNACAFLTRRKAVAKAQRKPKGFGKFASLMKKLVKVPKEEVDKLVSQSKRKRRKK